MGRDKSAQIEVLQQAKIYLPSKLPQLTSCRNPRAAIHKIGMASRGLRRLVEYMLSPQSASRNARGGM